MNHSLIALTLGLAVSFCVTTAYADGTINFEGAIEGGTCPIEIVNPGDGSIGGLVKMVNVNASTFTAAGQEFGGKPFILRVIDGAKCGLPAGGGHGKVTFSGAPEGTDYFAIRPGSDAADSVAISIRDSSSDAIGSGVASAEYPIADSGSSDMHFTAYYRSIGFPVTQGRASADIAFLVAVK